MSPKTTDPVHKRPLDLLANPAIAGFARSRTTHFWLQLFFVLLFLGAIITGFFGNPLAAVNFATVGTWLIWWVLIVFIILFIGKGWCHVCPWNALAEWVRWGTPWNRRQTPLSLNLPWPRFLRNIFPALLFFTIFVWLELGIGLTLIPAATALFALLLVAMAVVAAVLFRNMPFCRYLCPVGRVAGLYALVSPLELRCRDKDVCQSCRSKDCLRGNEAGYPCPTSQYPGRMDKNSYCIMCLECVKTCPHDNIRLSPRPFGADLLNPLKPRRDEAYGSIALLSLVFLHVITMVPPWTTLYNDFQILTGIGVWSNYSLAYVVSFTCLMLLLLALPALVHALATQASRLSAPASSRPTFGRTFLIFAYALLPLTLAVHLAHNLMHVSMEASDLVPVISDPFGLGWNLLGTGHLLPSDQLIPLSVLPSLQNGIILLGLCLSGWIILRLSRNLFPAGRSFLASTPFLLTTITYACLGWWLLSLPMMMKMPY